jgi:glutamate synthase (NADPH/NADH) small chain
MQAVQSEFLAIDRKSRARIPFTDIDHRDPQERICDFEDVVIALDAERAMLEASRCVHCPNPAACVTACPAHNDIPSAMWLIEQGQLLEAANLYRQTSSLPEICGRVCPHEQLCQGSCVRTAAFPVLTGATSLCQRLRLNSRRQHAPPGGERRNAIVGAGPARLACAERL